MNKFAPVKLARYLSWIVGGILMLLPFHAFLTVWLSSLVGHYTLLRLWKEVVLVIILAGVIYLLAKDRALRQKIWAFWPTKLILAYGLVLMAWGFGALALHNVSGKALWYGLLIDLRFLIFFLAIWIIAAKSSWLKSNWKRIIFAPAVIVAAFAILQYLILPFDFLKHFGYGPETISPFETINNNLNNLRVASTLKGANPLGAYLLLPISALAVLIFREKTQ